MDISLIRGKTITIEDILLDPNVKRPIYACIKEKVISTTVDISECFDLGL